MADKVRLYFDVSALQENLEEGEILDIVSFNIYEGASKDGTFLQIDIVDYNPQVSYVETENATDETQWFKLSYVDSDALESELSEAFLGEKIDQLIEDVALALGDLNREEESTMAFTDSEYLKKIKEAVRLHTGSKKIDGLEEADISLLIILVRISCCYDLAYDNAKYTKLSLPDGISLSKGDRVDQYLKIAAQLEARYEKIKKSWQSDASGEEGTLMGTPSFEVVELTRKPVFKNLGRFSTNRRF